MIAGNVWVVARRENQTFLSVLSRKSYPGRSIAVNGKWNLVSDKVVGEVAESHSLEPPDAKDEGVTLEHLLKR